MTDIHVPQLSLVLLVGVSGAGKSTFAGRHFSPSQVVSSDACRGIVSDDENDQTATSDAFDLLHHIVGVRLRRGHLTVVDATNVQPESRKSLIRLAKEHHVLVDAIVLDVDVDEAARRNRTRIDRDFGAHVLARQQRDLRRSLRSIRKEGFRRVHVLTGDEIDDVRIHYDRAWTDKTDVTGPFDIIGDIHGCRAELENLLVDLGYGLTRDDNGRAVGASHPEGRTAVFVGDLVDRGPDSPGVIRLVMGMVDAGTALCVAGNHEVKLVRALEGRKVRVAHGLAESLKQFADEPPEFTDAARRFMDGLISHYRLDGGRLVVAHAGLREDYHGRASGKVRSFALYGDTTGETDEMGLPVRYPWADEYRGEAMVVYGHTVVPSPEWVNNTICLDTGCVFGGELTALRYPEREIVSVPAEKTWYEPVRPLPSAAKPRQDTTLKYTDVGGTRYIDTSLMGRVKVKDENAAAALEVAGRFAIDPRHLVYLPPTMAPADTPNDGTLLEHPQQAFDHFASQGLEQVMCQEKHMGSRAVVVLTRTDVAGREKFGLAGPGVIYTRTGRSFFSDASLTAQLLTRLRTAAEKADMWTRLGTDWLVLDTELLPWSAKADGLIRSRYASVGAAATTALPAVVQSLEQAQNRGLDVDEALHRHRSSLRNAQAFQDVYTAYCWPTNGLDGVQVRPFQVLAAHGENLARRGHRWHMEQLAAFADADDSGVIGRTGTTLVDLGDEQSRGEAVDWWNRLTTAGGEGMVVKPVAEESVVHATSGKKSRGRLVQPALKVRGPEYLRIIYGPDYTEEHNMERLRKRSLGRKRNLALREYALGIEALDRLAAGQPLWKVHEAVFAVLALESEPVDPRL